MITRFDGRYSFLSNFYPCKIEYQGITYNSVETYYVAMKCNNDQMIDGRYYTAADFRELVSNIAPGKAKQLGKVIKVRSEWDSKKFGFIEWAVNEKFKDEKLKEMLLSTGDTTIVEGNWWHDNFYGQCTCEKCIGKGKNKLGKLLMQVRSGLNGTQKKGLESILW